MPTVMIPLALWKRFGLPGKPSAIPDDGLGRLGGWSLASAGYPSGELALFVNQRTMLSVVVPMEPLDLLLRMLPTRLFSSLVALGVGEAEAEAERLALAHVTLGKNTDRTLIGRVGTVVLDAEAVAESVHRLHVTQVCDEVQRVLALTPQSGGGRVPEAIARLFATRH